MNRRKFLAFLAATPLAVVAVWKSKAWPASFDVGRNWYNTCGNAGGPSFENIWDILDWHKISDYAHQGPRKD